MTEERNTMNEQHVKGAFNEVTGRVQSAAGALTGDTAQDLQGKARAARARLQGAYGDAADAVSSAGQSLGRTVQGNPMVAVLVAVAAGFFLGWAMHRD